MSNILIEPASSHLSNELLSKLRCPDCGGSLSTDPGQTLRCSCGAEFPIVHGVPFLLRSSELDRHLQADSGRPVESSDHHYSGDGDYHWKVYSIADLLPQSREGEEVLIVGCGDGETGDRLEKLGFAATGTDIRRSPGTAFVGDAQNLPVVAGSFDVILSTQVLEHVERPWIAVVEAARVLRPGGFFLGSVAFQKGCHGSYFHISHLGMASLLESAGLEVVELRGAQSPTYSLYGSLLPIGPRGLRRAVLGLVDEIIYRIRSLAYRVVRRVDPHEPTQRFKGPIPLSFATHDRLRQAPAVVFKARKPL